MRNLALPIVFAIATLAAGCGGGNDSATNATDANPKFSVAVLGDTPYGTGPTDTAQFLAMPAFLKTINSDPDIALALHVGDIHSGKEYCTEAYDLSVYDQLKTLKMPLIYTPGDNEWTDCHKTKEGGGTYNATTGMIDYNKDASGKLIDYAGGDPVANLDLVRSIFLSVPGKTLGGAMTVHSQALEFDTAHPGDSKYVENVWMMKSKVLFVTLNVPGGSNNDTDPWYGAPASSPVQTLEVASRTAANVRWINTAFDHASADGATAVVIMIQADMWDLDGKTAAHIAEYKKFIDPIAARTASFGKPVLLLNGDSHVFRSDNPLVSGASCVTEPSSGAKAVACTDDAYANQPNGYNVPNFHRVVTHGSTAPVEWLKLVVDPSAHVASSAYAFGPFSWPRVTP